MSVRRTLLSVREILIADDPEPWVRAGFTVGRDGTILLGTPAAPLVLRLLGRTPGSKGVIGWGLQTRLEAVGPDMDVIDIDGLLTNLDSRPNPVGPWWDPEAFRHRNGVQSLDQLVVQSQDPEALLRALREELGMEPRRVAERAGVPQYFYLTPHFVLEVIGPLEPKPSSSAESRSRFWGLGFTTSDPSATQRHFSTAQLSAFRPAVQPGRQIAVLRPETVGISTRVVFLTPRPRRRPNTSQDQAEGKSSRL